MKNLNFIHGICIAGTVFLATSVPTSYVFSQEQVLEVPAHSPDSVGVNKEDKKFVTEAIQMNLNEIALAKLAQGKDLPSHVELLANAIGEDHMQSMADLSTLAQSKNIPLETPETEEKSVEHQELETLEGNEFGIAYSKLMVERHKKAIDKFENASKNSEDAEIKFWASEWLTVLNAHLEAAQKCVTVCEITSVSPETDI